MKIAATVLAVLATAMGAYAIVERDYREVNRSRRVRLGYLLLTVALAAGALGSAWSAP